MINININRLKQYILWIIAYLPLIFVSVFSGKNIPFLKGNQDIIKGIIFIILLIIIYFFSAKLFLRLVIRSKKNKVGQIKNVEQISINEYSYFILTLFMPLLFEDMENIFDYIVLFALITIIIIIFTRTDHIIVNPIFILNNLVVCKVEIQNVDKTIRGYGLIKPGLDYNQRVDYFLIFPNLYYVYRQNKS
ncbi:hypothetical protein [Macrococcoides caseolyticum]|uniref:hypothetical protein n=1 Tax=Macrococcoides caseolyticum TaxID=69966 RepID=UPI000C333F84|nr:hypothetical protein [Macrococcus caseolyticus]PKD98520.1 hypothetical protein CW719_07670 [Macrococcus caseolyticus]PKF18721.1 hypothetical protein CW717_07670 [Macrococcus caseolyticus]